MAADCIAARRAFSSSPVRAFAFFDPARSAFERISSAAFFPTRLKDSTRNRSRERGLSAAIPEIEKEIDLALKDLGRELKTFLSRRDRHKLQEDRARALCAIIPEIAAKVAEITEKPVPDTTPIEGRIMHRLVAKKWTAGGTVRIAVRNYTDRPVTPTLYDTSPDPAPDADPKPGYAHAVGDDHTRVWKLSLAPGEGWEARYTGKGGGTLDLQGIDEKEKMVVDLDV
jgi:DNA topoisomerase-6 subunit B